MSIPTALPAEPPDITGPWLWLFPATFAIHLVEEGLAAEGFYQWIRRLSGREIGRRSFFAANLAFELVMVAAVHHARTDEDGAWVVPALGLITATNGSGHLLGSAVTRSYSPGAVSGAGLWAPLGVIALVRSRRALSRRDWRRGMVAGLLVSAALVPLALAVSRRSG